MSANAKVSGSWKNVTGISCRVSGTWKEVTKGWCRVSGAWKEFYSKGFVLYAWGDNTYGQLGDGTTTNRLSPTVIGSCTWKAISGGRYHSLGIRADDKLYAWGDNTYGQLGDGTTTQRESPTAIGSCTWKAIAGGYYHSLGLK